MGHSVYTRVWFRLCNMSAMNVRRKSAKRQSLLTRIAYHAGIRRSENIQTGTLSTRFQKHQLLLVDGGFDGRQQKSDYYETRKHCSLFLSSSAVLIPARLSQLSTVFIPPRCAFLFLLVYVAEGVRQEEASKSSRASCSFV